MAPTIGGYLENCRKMGKTPVRGTVNGYNWELRVALAPIGDWHSHAESISLPRDLRGITGYYTDEHGHGDTMQPCVALLPHGRFLAGWTMGEGMFTDFESGVYTDEREAWISAHYVTDSAAEREREYQASLCQSCFDAERAGDAPHPDYCNACNVASGEYPLPLHATS
jgi:hypothetical protein